ncbi:helix-turn-helix transcriptional regulator [Chitinimonas koreensis]|uniref:helix-turn-helix transcriptional regulator n=1 Tax=Chitinimonas koreensis TaxID=356302 RepID=UPI0006846302|nr:AlpA family phage regulatory protein [Chitinimonas koreensis]QNM95454.1 AlpA family phage regulatory protein [Chitinimonas koreensis]
MEQIVTLAGNVGQANAEHRRLIPLSEVESRSGLKKSKIYSMIGESAFPRPIKLGKLSRWVEAEVDEWIDKQVTASKAAMAEARTV